MWEPRGHADMYGCLITPPAEPGSDFGVLFLHNEGFSTMCGHGIIAVTRVALEGGLLPITQPETVVRIDTPAGLVVATAEIEDGAVRAVRFANVPSYAAELDARVDVPGLGEIRYDLGFGGAFYAYVDAEALELDLSANGFRDLIDVGMRIKRAVMESREIVHHGDADLGFLYGTIFVGAARDPKHHSRNVCIFADGEVDRSPTGTGVSGRLAIHHARGELPVGESITIESILGTCFEGRVLEETRFGPHAAIVPEVRGMAHVTGFSELVIGKDDPLADGFVLR